MPPLRPFLSTSPPCGSSWPPSLSPSPSPAPFHLRGPASPPWHVSPLPRRAGLPPRIRDGRAPLLPCAAAPRAPCTPLRVACSLPAPAANARGLRLPRLPCACAPLPLRVAAAPPRVWVDLLPRGAFAPRLLSGCAPPPGASRAPRRPCALYLPLRDVRAPRP